MRRDVNSHARPQTSKEVFLSCSLHDFCDRKVLPLRKFTVKERKGNKDLIGNFNLVSDNQIHICKVYIVNIVTIRDEPPREAR